LFIFVAVIQKNDAFFEIQCISVLALLTIFGNNS